MVDIKNNIDNWLTEVLKRSKFSCSPMALSDSNEWVFKDGLIKHKTGRFFSIVGASWEDPSNITLQQPMIDQREIGILGFAIREKNGRKELLAHAKLEPGNIGAVQIAPTCQATASNIAMAHGGTSPPFSDFFSVRDSRMILSNSLQSEQGSRFYGKMNRNLLILTDGKFKPGPLHRWIDSKDLIGLIDNNFFINTDARSVLVTCPWKELVSWEPFSMNHSGFGQELFSSMKQKCSGERLMAMQSCLLKLRSRHKKPTFIDIRKLCDWEFDERSDMPLKGRGFSVRHIKVSADIREVPQWDQPIIDSHSEGAVDLFCGNIEGILHFAFKPQTEPGLTNITELGPTSIREPGAPKLKGQKNTLGKTVIETRQSDEGGRFFKDKNRYRIRHLGNVTEITDDYFWLTISEIEGLLVSGGWFTNEARSALSLLLKWL